MHRKFQNVAEEGFSITNFFESVSDSFKALKVVSDFIETHKGVNVFLGFGKDSGDSRDLIETLMLIDNFIEALKVTKKDQEHHLFVAKSFEAPKVVSDTFETLKVGTVSFKVFLQSHQPSGGSRDNRVTIMITCDLIKTFKFDIIFLEGGLATNGGTEAQDSSFSHSWHPYGRVTLEGV